MNEGDVSQDALWAAVYKAFKSGVLLEEVVSIKHMKGGTRVFLIKSGWIVTVHTDPMDVVVRAEVENSAGVWVCEDIAASREWRIVNER